jgi:CheY-like chemotaxis protein
VAGESTAEAVARTRPGDVLLIDHAAGEAPRRPPANRAAIILLNASERGLLETYRKVGYAGYLIKPLRRVSLAERVLIAAVGPTGARAGEDERIADTAAPGAKVLLVEDNPVNALLARALLTREGCAVDHVRSGAEALEAAKFAAYDIVLMDMRMPGLSGVETARLLRADGVETPIVALTANAFEDDRRACMAAGMVDFLVKPLAPEALRAVLSRWAGKAWTAPATRAKVS